jgi:hypothetical protein
MLPSKGLLSSDSDETYLQEDSNRLAAFMNQIKRQLAIYSMKFNDLVKQGSASQVSTTPKVEILTELKELISSFEWAWLTAGIAFSILTPVLVFIAIIGGGAIIPFSGTLILLSILFFPLTIIIVMIIDFLLHSRDQITDVWRVLMFIFLALSSIPALKIFTAVTNLVWPK